MQVHFNYFFSSTFEIFTKDLSFKFCINIFFLRNFRINKIIKVLFHWHLDLIKQQTEQSVTQKVLVFKIPKSNDSSTKMPKHTGFLFSRENSVIRFSRSTAFNLKLASMVALPPNLCSFLSFSNALKLSNLPFFLLSYSLLPFFLEAPPLIETPLLPSKSF